MNYFEWNLDDMEVNEDLYDSMGYIKILGDEGVFEEKDTFVDVFLEAFVEGVERMESEGIVRIDPLVEPNDIVFNYKNSSIEIEYGIQRTTILNKIQFLEELQYTVIKFLEELDEFANNSKQEKRKFAKLRSFVVAS
jgi:hypothetical protein